MGLKLNAHISAEDRRVLNSYASVEHSSQALKHLSKNAACALLVVSAQTKEKNVEWEPRNPLLTAFKEKKVSLGLLIDSAPQIALCAKLGFDWFKIDQMFTGNDWSRTESLIIAGKASGISPVIRIQGAPWLGYDHRLAVDVCRCQGIGGQFIMVPHSCNKEIEESLQAAKGWQRNSTIVHPFNSLAEWTTKIDVMQDEGTFVIPQVESKQGMEEIEKTLDTPGVKMYFLAMTDASRVLSGREEPDWDLPELWKYVDKAVAIGEKKGIMIGANTSFAYTMKEVRARVKRLYDAGVKMIQVQQVPFLFQIAMNEWLDGVNKDLNRS